MRMVLTLLTVFMFLVTFSLQLISDKIDDFIELIKQRTKEIENNERIKDKRQS